MSLLNKFKKFINPRVKITLLNDDWTIRCENVKLKNIPNQGDLIFDDISFIYLEVLKVIYYLNENNICIIIKPITNNEIN